MTPRPKEKLIVDAKGMLRAIVSPLTEKIAKTLGGPVSIRRASHVEPSSELSLEAIRWLAHHRPDCVATYQDDHSYEFKFTTTDAKWWADMLPVNLGVLGPFTTREEALAAEVAELQKHNIPTADAML
jgi:hypothetical protein